MDLFLQFGGLLLGFVLTLFIYSYVLQDNPLYRLAVHLLVGVSAAYAAVIAVEQVVLPVLQALADDPGDPANLVWLAPLFLAFLLLLKLIPATAGFGNSAMAVLFAIGGAVGLIGAIAGTLIPLSLGNFGYGTANLPGRELLGVVSAILTVFTLGYFHFTGRLTPEGEVVLPAVQRYVAFAGRIVITITLGAIFAGVLNTSLILLTERVGFFFTEFVDLFLG